MKSMDHFLRGFCFVYAVLLLTDGLLALVAFLQLYRIHARNRCVGWTRQKVFHFMIGASNIGYAIYFTYSIVAERKERNCWSHAFGFIIMALPQIIFLSAFLLLLSFWVDLIHQPTDPDDVDEDDNTSFISLPSPSTQEQMKLSVHRKARNCCSFWRHLHIRSRQKIVIIVVLLISALAIVFCVLIWVGTGSNPIDSSSMAQIYSDIFVIVILISGGGLACYGLLLNLKMSKVRSERASADIKKVSVLAVAAVVCFTLRALLVLCTDVPVLSIWHTRHPTHSQSPLLIFLYYFIGSSIPSSVVLWVMREMPTRHSDECSRHRASSLRESEIDPNELLFQQWIIAAYGQDEFGLTEDDSSISSTLQTPEARSS